MKTAHKPQENSSSNPLFKQFPEAENPPGVSCRLKISQTAETRYFNQSSSDILAQNNAYVGEKLGNMADTTPEALWECQALHTGDVMLLERKDL